MLVHKAIFAKAETLLQENVSTILTATGVVGTVTTALLTGKASIIAHDLIREKEMHVGAEEHRELERSEKFLLAGPQFIPPVIVGVGTITAIIAANRISAKEAAALAAAYGVSQKQLDEYKSKISEKLTGPKEKSIKDEIAQDRVESNPPNEVIILADGDVLCYDMLTGRYFRSSVERIRKAMHVIQTELSNYQAVSLSHFYDEVGLPATNFTDSMGWSAMDQDTSIDVELTTTMTPDEKPCIAVDFTVMPRPDYTRV